MTNEVKDRAAADSQTDEEKRYPDHYGLYRRWFTPSGDEEAANDATISSAELGELWRRWFEATAGTRDETMKMDKDFVGTMTPLWTEMAEDASQTMLSGETLPEDPLRFFLRWYNDTKERWSKVADELLKKDEVLESISHFIEVEARSYREARRTVEEGLNNLQIPTRSDVARVARLIIVVENKVDRVEEAFEEFIYGDSEPATAGAVDSLEERMDRLENKMDRVLAALEEIKARGEPELSGTSQGASTQKTSDEAAAPSTGYA